MANERAACEAEWVQRLAKSCKGFLDPGGDGRCIVGKAVLKLSMRISKAIADSLPDLKRAVTKDTCIIFWRSICET